MWQWLALLCLLTAWPAVSSALVVDLPFMEYLDSNQLVLLQWGFDSVQENITFKVSVQGTGWIGFGLSPNGNMLGADMVIGGVGTNGIYFTDRHATGKFLPIVDSRQSYELLSMTEVEGRTSMTFQRAIQTCDEEDFHITPKPLKLIYAYGDTDDIEYHETRRGTKTINLLKYMPRTAPPDRVYFDFAADNFTVPTKKTHYHCSVKKMPRLKETHHVYRIEPVIDNLDLVHHMLLYGCPWNVTEDYQGPCYIGSVVDTCFRVIAAWGVGGGPFELPEDAGIPIGGNNNDVLYRLEVHYNNPTGVAGRQDSSGLRIFYTSKLRRHHAGTLSVGVPPLGFQYKIPPGATAFHAYGTCQTSVFPQLMDGPVPDLHVFALFFHTHLAGRKVRAAIFRNEVQVDFLSVNEHFDFELQEGVTLGNIKTIKPNDDVLVECVYNTTDRKAYTKMGLTTMDEMCLTFLLYYPEIPVHACWSSPDMTTVDTVPNVVEPADQEDIINYQRTLRRLPQYLLLKDNGTDLVFHTEARVLNMTDSPTTVCQESPARSKGGAARSCRYTVQRCALLLLLLWGGA